jgi:hypothetical protein
MTPESRKPEEVRETLFKEYDTLRDESLQSMGNRTQIVSFGMGTIGLLLGGLMASPTRDPLLIYLVCSLAVPVISALAYLTWFAEFDRMVRAGAWLQRLEERINNTFDHARDPSMSSVPPGRQASAVLGWESTLNEDRLTYPYLSVAALFLGFAFATPIIGIAVTPTDPRALEVLHPWVRVHTGNSYASIAYVGVGWTAVALAVFISVRRRKVHRRSYGM